MSKDNQSKLAIGAGLGTIALAAVAYFGLTTFAPEKKVVAKSDAVTPEAVFAQDTASTPPASDASATEAGSEQMAAAPAEAAAPEAAPSADAAASDAPVANNTSAAAAPADPVAEAATASAAGVMESSASASGSLSAEDARKIGEEVARQVATQVAQKIVDDQLAKGGSGSSSAASGGLTAEEARAIGREEGRKVAEEVARSVVASNGGGGGGGSGLTAEQAEQIGLAAGRRAAKQVAAKTARDVVRREFGGQVTASGSAPAASESGSAVVASATPGKPRGSTAGKSNSHEAGADALRSWWPSTNAGDFGLLYAGQPKGEGAIALLFSNTPNAGALGEGVKVYDAKGNVISGSWEAAANPRLVVFRGVKPGRYTVVVQPTLADSSGKTIGKPAHGPVYVTT